MNKCILKGRLATDPEVRYSNGQQQMCIAKYRLAVNRPKDKDGNQQADFINCIAFGNRGEFAEKYLRKGSEILIEGHIQTGSYENRDGNKVYTTDVIIDQHYFCGSGNGPRGSSHPHYNSDFAQVNEKPPRERTNPTYSGAQQGINDGFMPIDDELEDDGDLPF